MKIFGLIICFILIFSGCTSSVPSELILYDFESDSELNNIYWKCHTLINLSSKYVTHGQKSLQLELYPSNYPGWSPVLNINDWHEFEALCLDIYNPEYNEVPVSIRIDDRDDSPGYDDRYNISLLLEPGMNHIRLLLDSVITSRTQRKMNLNKIELFLVFMANPSKKFTLYIDYVRLVS